MDDFQEIGDPIDKLYSTLKKKGYYTKSIGEFKQKYSSPESIDKLYEVVNRDGLYTKTKDDFYKQYYPTTVTATPKKKEDTQQAIIGLSKIFPSTVKNLLTGAAKSESATPSTLTGEDSFRPEQAEIDPNDPVKSYLQPDRDYIKEFRERRRTVESVGQNNVERMSLTNIVNNAKQKEADVIQNTFQSGNDARAYLLNATGYDPDKLDAEAVDKIVKPDNETQTLAKNKYLKVRSLKEDAQNSNTFEQLALKQAARKGGVTKKQVDYLGESLPTNMKGELILQLLSDNDLYDAAKDNPKLQAEIDEQAYSLPERYPATAIKYMAQMVSKKREEMGENNGILNIPSEATTTEIMNQLVKDGDLTDNFLALYNKKGVPQLVTSNLKTPGFVENVLQGAEQGIMGIGKTAAELTGIRSLYKDKADQTFQALGEQYQQIGFKPKGLLHEISTSGGNIVGQVLPMVAGGSALRASNLLKSDAATNILMTGLQTYGYNLENARTQLPDAGANEQVGLALTNTGIEMALANTFNDMKFARGLMKSASQDVKKLVDAFTKKEISAAAAKTRLGEIFDGVVEFGKKTGKVAVSEANEESATQYLQNTANKVFGGEQISDRQNFNEAFDVWKTTFLGSLVLGGVGGAANKMNEMPTSAIVYEMASNPEKYKTIINDYASVDEDVDASKDERIKNLDYASSVLSELNKRKLPEDKKANYLVKSLNEKILKEEASKIGDPLLKKDSEKKLAELEISKKALLDPEMNNTKIVQEFFDNELLGKSSLENLSIRDEEGKPTNKFDPSKVGEYLKEAAQRLNNLDSDWQPNKAGDSSKAAKESYPEAIAEIANERWKKEIEAAQQRLDLSTEIGEPEQISQPIELSVDTQQAVPEGGGRVVGEKSILNSDVDLKGNNKVQPYQTADEYIKKEVRVSSVSDRFNYDEETAKNDHIEFVRLAKDDKSIVQDKNGDYWQKDYTDDAMWHKVGEDGKWIDDSENWEENNKDDKPKGRELTRYEYGIETGEISPQDVKKIIESAGLEVPKYISKQSIKEQPKAETPTPTQEAVGDLPPTNIPPTSKGPYVERPGTELSFRGLQNVANEFGLEDVSSRERKSDVQLFADARKTADEWIAKGEYSKNIEKLLKGVEDGSLSLRDEQRVILQQYLANEVQKLRDIKDKNPPEWQQQFNVVKRIKEVGNIARSEAGAALRIPVGGYSHPIKDYGDAMMAMEEVTGKELTPELKAEVDKYVANYEEKLKIAEEKVMEVEAKYAELQAQKEVAAVSKKTKKTSKDYSAERKQIVTDIREKLKKIRQEQNVTVVPYAKELFTIAPDVAKLVKSLVEQGISKLEDIVTEIHSTLKDDIPDIQENDVVDIIAGKYNEPKETRADLEKRLKQIGNKNSTEAVKIRAKIKAGDFEKPAKKVSWVNDPELKKKYPKAYNEAIDALSNKEEAVHEFDVAVAKEELKKLKGRAKFGFWAKGVFSTTKALASGIDFSGIGMQNLVSLISHPRSALKSLPQSFVDLVSEKTFRRRLVALHNSPEWSDIQNSGLDITDPKSLRPESKEEIFSGNLLDRPIKVRGKKYILSKYLTKPFERQFTSLGNNMRVNMFLRITDRWKQKGKTFETDPESYKALARLLNTQTGRGDVPKAIKDGTNLVNSIVWSPRLIASRLNLLGISDLRELVGGKGFYTQLTPEIRKMAIADMVKFIGAGTALMAMSAYWGAEVDDDPESATFGTIKIGDKKYNAWGGFTPYVKTIWQSASGKRKTQDGYKPANAGELLLRFGRSRMTPAAGALTNIALERDFSGKPVTPQSQLLNMITPISIKGIWEGLEKDGLKGIITQGIPSIVGVNVSDERDFQKKDTSKPQVKRPKMPKKPEKQQ